MIKFNRVNGYTYKTADNQYMIYNAGPKEWYSAPIDSELVEKFGYSPVAVDESNKMFHTSLRNAQDWVRVFDYKSQEAN